MDVPQLSPELREALRTWFHSKDRSVYLADNTFAYLPGGVGYLSLAFISETALTASASSVTFSSIPQDFRQLLITCQARSDRATTGGDSIDLQINGDTGANYDWNQILGTGATASASASRAQTAIRVGICDTQFSRGNNFAPAFIWIMNYSRNDAEARLLAMSSRIDSLAADTDMLVTLRAANWRNTNVVMSVSLFPVVGNNFVARSRFQLYGVL